MTIQHIPSGIKVQLSNSLNEVIKLYVRGGLIIRVILMEMKFDNLAENLGKIEVNVRQSREHVGGVESTIMKVKEDRRETTNRLPY